MRTFAYKCVLNSFFAALCLHVHTMICKRRRAVPQMGSVGFGRAKLDAAPASRGNSSLFPPGGSEQFQRLSSPSCHAAAANCSETRLPGNVVSQ